MESFMLILIVLLVLATVAINLKRNEYQAADNPYARKQILFSSAERSLLGVLDQMVGEEYRVFGKVRVADVVEPRRGMDNSKRQKAFNRISDRHFDFVLCSKNDLSVVCAVELDDQSHRQPNRQERDVFLVGFCQAVSLPLIRVSAQRDYSVPELRAKVLGALGHRQEPVLEASPAQSPAPPAALPVEPVALAKLKLHRSPQASPQHEAPVCPKCASPMVHRRAKSGINAGQEFWGCSTFPKCRGVIRFLSAKLVTAP